ncbi:MAG: hypothetical protein P4M11_03735, partial [Candidatus Pacebacteria bacterium]|nr:hypothetical protein [Candidatus Paceibacterota bacterium]
SSPAALAASHGMSVRGLLDDGYCEEKEPSHPNIVVAKTPSAPRPSNSSSTFALNINNHLAALFESQKQQRNVNVKEKVAASSTPDLVCHCLIVNSSKLVADSEDHRFYQKASTADPQSIHGIVSEWLRTKHVDVNTISAVYMQQQQPARLHINFNSFDSLAAAQASCEFLTRCGSIGVSRWNSTPCGPPRHQLPELLQFSFTPPNVVPRDSTLETAIKQLLEKMSLSYTEFWFSRENSSSNHRGLPSTEIKFNVLPMKMDLASVRSVIENAHMKCELLESKLRVHAPNTPSLFRCNQCNQLGHRGDNCVKYEGIAIRFLMKEKVSLHAANTLAARLGDGARALLGSDFDEKRPSHRVTILFAFPPSIDNESEKIDHVAKRIQAVLPDYIDSLHQPPSFMQIRDRKRECRECGHLDSAHECPFISRPGFSSQNRVAQLGQGRQSSMQPRPVGINPTINSAAAPVDKMCKSWRLKKSCPRMESGRPCQYDHPSEHVATIQCFAWSNTGSCPSGAQCKYAAGHINNASSIAAPAPAAATNISAPAPAASSARAAAPVPASAVSASSSRPVAAATTAAASLIATHLRSAKKAKRAREEKEEGNEDGEEKQSREEDQESASDQDGMMDVDHLSVASTPAATPAASPNKRGNKKQRQQPAAAASTNLEHANRFAGIAEAEEDSSPSTPTRVAPQSSLSSFFSSPARTNSRSRGQTTPNKPTIASATRTNCSQ